MSWRWLCCSVYCLCVNVYCHRVTTQLQLINIIIYAGPSGSAVKGVGLPPLACWDRGFQSHRGAWLFVCCECCVLSGRGLCDELITRPEESYRLWCVVVCDLENLKNEEAMTRVGSQRHRKKIVVCIVKIIHHYMMLHLWLYSYSSIAL